MDALKRPGFPRGKLRARYDVEDLKEDEWHQLSDEVTATVLSDFLYPFVKNERSWILNAGAGVHTLRMSTGRELPFDLFLAPIAGRPFAVCGSIEALPFGLNTFDGIVCVGEVLGYCDPSRAFSEFARVIRPHGILIIDFGSTRSLRLFATKLFGRPAAVLSSEYNGSAEKTWIYDPGFVTNRLSHSGFVVRATVGAHAWSSLVSRIGVSNRTAINVERVFRRYVRLTQNADTITIVAEAMTTSRQPP